MSEINKLSRGQITRDARVGADIKALNEMLDARNDAAATSGQGPVVVSPLQRWEQKVRAMSEHPNPFIRKIGANQIKDYYQRATGIQKQREKGISSRAASKPSVPLGVYMKMSETEKADVDAHGKFNRPQGIQKYRILEEAKTADEVIRAVNYLGMDKWHDMGTHMQNLMLANLPEEDQVKVKKHVSEYEAKKKTGQAEGAYVANWEENLNMSNVAIDNNKYTMAALEELKSRTGHDSTGFAAWLKDIPTSKAGVWEDMKETVLSRLAIDQMVKMKESSATGATGFGALSQGELLVLQSYLGRLRGTSSKREIKQQIGNIHKELERLNKRSRARQRKAISRYQELEHLSDNPIDIQFYSQDGQYLEGMD